MTSWWRATGAVCVNDRRPTVKRQRSSDNNFLNVKIIIVSGEEDWLTAGYELLWFVEGGAEMFEFRGKEVDPISFSKRKLIACMKAGDEQNAGDFCSSNRWD